ncbi:MAG TPA: hypothetical protein VKK79_12115 [Candidatus Lokiarchaeia archaeon]|nr:hypothetical protein [Candidatus Lokiarchaeia archaeon]
MTVETEQFPPDQEEVEAAVTKLIGDFCASCTELGNFNRICELAFELKPCGLTSADGCEMNLMVQIRQAFNGRMAYIHWGGTQESIPLLSDGFETHLLRTIRQRLIELKQKCDHVSVEVLRCQD